MMLSPGFHQYGNNPAVASPTTWNPSNKSGTVTLSGGNLTATDSSGASCGVNSISQKTTGKWHWEVTMNLSGNPGSPNPGIGFADVSNHNFPTTMGGDVYSGGYRQNGNIVVLNSTVATTTALSNGDTVAVELDLDLFEVSFQRFGGSRMGPYSIASLSGTGGIAACINMAFASDNCTANFGATTFLIAPTDGFAMGLG